MKDSTLRKVYMLVWEKDKETEKVSNGCEVIVKWGCHEKNNDMKVPAKTQLLGLF